MKIGFRTKISFFRVWVYQDMFNREESTQSDYVNHIDEMIRIDQMCISADQVYHVNHIK